MVREGFLVEVLFDWQGPLKTEGKVATKPRDQAQGQPGSQDKRLGKKRGRKEPVGEGPSPLVLNLLLAV